MASNGAYAKALAQWKAAYPYIASGSTGIKLGDYEDSKRKFYEAYGRATPAPQLNWDRYDAGRIEQGYSPTFEDYIQNAAYDAWEKGQSDAFYGQLTPQQKAEYTAQKSAKYDAQNKMAQAAFLAAVGGMAAPGLIGAMGAQGGGAVGLGEGAMGLGTEGALGAGSGLSGAAAGLTEGMGVGSGLGMEGFGSGLGLSAGGGSLGGIGSGLGSGLGSVAGGTGSPSFLSQLGSLFGGGSGGGMNWTNLLGNLGSGLINSYTSGKAADAQLRAGQDANALLKYMYDQSRADQAPYRQAGTSALAGIQALLKDPSSISTMPDYQFGLDQGNKALANSAAARGMTYSGQQGKALQRYGQDYAGTKLNESYNRLAGIAGIGQQATNQTGAAGQNYANNASNNLTDMGNAQGSAYIGQGNAWTNAIGGALNGMSEQALIDALKKYNGG